MSNIEWTDETWNPIVGCSKQSAGCKNCYAMHMAARLEAMGVPQYQGLTTKHHGKVNWTGKARLVESALEKPMRWRKPRRIFVNSMGDLFHMDTSFEYVEKVWNVVRKCPQHQFQILTKRPEIMVDFVNICTKGTPDNVWLGTSIEDEEAVARLADLRMIDHPNLFVSFEPLIGSVGKISLKGIKWAIAGGESGLGARPMNPTWVQEIYDACQLTNTAFFFKQWGAFGEDSIKRPKKANGRLWQGREWNDCPAMGDPSSAVAKQEASQ